MLRIVETKVVCDLRDVTNSNKAILCNADDMAANKVAGAFTGGFLHHIVEIARRHAHFVRKIGNARQSIGKLFAGIEIIVYQFT